MSLVHFAGGVIYDKANGRTVEILAGYAACCSGERAEKIRREKRQSYDEPGVTCNACLRVLSKQRNRYLDHEKSGRSPLEDYYRTATAPNGRDPDGWLSGKVYSCPPCGCDIVGAGTLPQPLRIVFCKRHREAVS